jgi:hypothetical protein
MANSKEVGKSKNIPEMLGSHAKIPMNNPPHPRILA